VILAGASGCDEAPSPIAAEYVVAPEFTEIPGIERIREVPARSIEVPAEARAWDTSGTALEATLADGDWHATVAFKAASSTRIAANTSGRAVRHAVTEETIEDGLRLLASSGVQVIRYNALIAGAHVVFPRGVASELREHELIDYIEPRHVRYEPGGAPLLRPAPARLVGQTTPIGAQVVRASSVWGSYTGSGVSVGTIDDGYDRGHDDLYTISTSNCWDGDSNDCWQGWHGTFVAGVAAALNNSDGVVGVAPGIGSNFYWCKGGTNTDVAECIDRLDGSAQIINMSFGSTGFSQDVADAVDAAYGAGRLLVSIANNRDSATTSTPPSNMYPAEHDDVIGVSGVMPDSSFASGPAGLCTYVPYDSIFAEWGRTPRTTATMSSCQRPSTRYRLP
jgi:subtilisin family serine protease